MKAMCYRYGEFDYRYEELMFNHLEKVIKKLDEEGKKSLLLLGNYVINGIKSNAIVVTANTIILFIFKNYFGKITSSVSGNWTTIDGKIVEGGYGGISPYKQAHIGKVQIERHFANILQNQLNIKVCLVFQDGASISKLKQNWLDVINISNIEFYLSQLEPVNELENEIISEVLKSLNISADSNRIQNLLSPSEATLDFFEDLEKIVGANAPIREKYNRMWNVLSNAINQKINGVSLKFTGPFSKIQYLIREYSISKDVAIAINDTRVRIRYIENKNDRELLDSFLIDLKAVCIFIHNIYEDVNIPNSLSAIFPVQRGKKYRKLLRDRSGVVFDYIRCVINEWDELYMYVTIESTGEEAKVDYTTSQENNLNADWSYVGKLLEKGDVVNLVKPRIENDIIFPELIIYNPDYLVNVTTIAGCFEEYGMSEKLNLINKIQPMPCTQAILLGNFAGQMLDELSYHEKISYSDSMRRFFQKNALSFACCQDSLTTFHIDAKNQRNIIDKVIVQEKKVHQKNGKIISSEELMLEPSYFCEALGLQGRMDFVHYNLKTVIEQKSGNCAWTGRTDIVKQLQKHYVQLLLYRAIFHYAYKKIDYDDLASWLFYSKYTNGLLELDSAPELLFKALKIRNLIVWSEKLYTKQGMFILETLDADRIFPNVTNPTYLKWGKDRINVQLGPIHKASDLERAYYFRFMRFIANEHMLSKVGNKTKEDSGFAAMWNSTLQERKQAGNIYDGLEIEPLKENKNVETVKFFFAEKVDQDVSNFRVGDIVVFYPYNVLEEPNVTLSLVFRCTIVNISLDSVEVKLRNTQNKKVFDNIINEYRTDGKHLVWAIEHDFMESSYSSLYRGIHAFLSANKDRRDLILGKRKPKIDESQRLVGNYGSQEFNDLVLRAKQAQDVYLIVGPPGTGKTSFGMLNVLLEHLTEPTASILLMAYTNRAVDEICSKLVENNLDFIRLGSDTCCSREYRKYLLDSKIAAIPNVKIDDVRNEITSCRIFCGTTTAFNSKTEIFNLKKFDLAIIDEASQILEPFILGLLSATYVENGKKENAISKFVLIGDEKQLPAVVQQDRDESVVNEPMLNGIGLVDCRLSLFERFEKLFGKKDERYCHVLTHQGRMHPEIAKFPNYAFYQNSLKPVPVEHQKEKTLPVGLGKNGIEDLLLTRRVAFLASMPSLDSNESDKINSVEAKMIAATVIQGYLMKKDSFDVNKSIGVIVPYRNQISVIRNIIDKMSEEKGITCLHDITIDTVERYQGSQRDLIIYGFTAKRNYQLKFLTSNEYYDEDDGAIIDRKLNVAMTRARKNLVLVGYDCLLSQDITFYKLIEYCKSIQSYFCVDVEKYINGNFSVPRVETLDNAEFDTSVFMVDSNFEQAFNKLVVEPIKAASNTKWPNIILGNNKDVNMNIIGYGRIDFSNQLSLFSEFDGEETVVSPQRQVLLYSYYIMRQHYCSLKTILASYEQFVKNKLSACRGRLHFIDIGCGPSTCGSAFFNTFVEVEHADYIGVDISNAMKELACKFMEEQKFANVKVKYIESFNELSDKYWEIESEVASLFVFNISYFFSNVDSAFAERLAMRIMKVINEYPLNQYLFVIQQSETDCKSFSSYRVFKKIILDSPSMVKVYKSGEDNFSYQLNGGSKSLKFCYDIWGN